MDSDDRQFLFTTAWLFAHHGQTQRAKTLCQALVEDQPRDGVAAAALAELLLQDHQAEEALQVLLAADFPPELERAEALLESKALAMLGRKEDSSKRWKRYEESAKGNNRTWIKE